MNRFARRPRLLVLSQTLPYPPDGGVKIRTYHILRLLARHFDLTALCFYRAKGGAREADLPGTLAGLAPLGRFEAFPIPQEHSRVRLIWDHARSVASRRAYTVHSYASRPYRQRLSELLHSDQFDLVHSDSLDLSRYFPLVRHLPLVCVHHDIQSRLLRRRAAVERSRVRAAYIDHQAELMRREEQRQCPRASLNVTVSDEDAGALRVVAPESRIIVVPNGVDTNYFVPGPGQQEGLVFVGGTTWFPNKDALEYFAAEMLPRIAATMPGLPIRWVGRATQKEIADYTRRGIQMSGYVEDVRPWVRNAACYIVPIRVGGGTRVKILDAWAMGTAVVSTSIGCEGLDTSDGENILIRDDPQEFVDAVTLVIRNAALRRHLGQAGRQTVMRKYAWDTIEDSMVPHYRALLRGNRR